MFRAPRARSLIASITTICFLSVAFAPFTAFAQGANIGEVLNLQCNAHNSGGVCSGPFPGIPGSMVTGKCDGTKICEAKTYTSPTGQVMSIADAPTAVTDALNPSLLTQAGNLISAHPILSVLGLGVAMSLGSSLLGSLLAPKTGSSGSGSNYTPGTCTTQYYFTSDSNALVDPCALYNPSSPTTPINSTCPIVIAPLCFSGTLVQQPNDANNCPVAPVCNSGTTSPATCPLVLTPPCLNGTLVAQPNDANNCAVAAKCVSGAGTSTGTADTLSVSPNSGMPPLVVTANFQSGPSCADAYDLSWGDGSPDVTMMYSPPGFGSACTQVALVNAPTHTYTGAGTYTPTLRSGTSLQFTSTVTVNVGSSATSNPSGIGLTATPTSGNAPLTVQFSGNVPGTSYTLNFGDGSAPVGGVKSIDCTSANPNCAAGATIAVNASYTYAQNGSYQAAVYDSSGARQGTAVVTVGTVGTPGGDGSTSTPVPISTVLNSTVYYDDTTSASTLDPSQTPLAQNATPAPGQGLKGDLLSAGGGATIYATNVSGNTEVSGFFGSNSAPAQLCQSRPWSTNFISHIIPATFFDNLCNLAGYPTGAQQSSTVPAGGSGGSQSVSVAPPQQTTQPQYTGAVQAAATIWARPPSVSLGGRTNIFWISQNVSSCTESSSDGNFSGSSTSGGASTVALSGPVTFTIKCLSLDGTTISNSTTVTIGS
jgi:PKD repeat protein